MKRLCCNKIIFFLLTLVVALQASLDKKSAIVYYGDQISYPTVGIHDYIIVEPRNTNVYTHGFSLYKKKIYAYVSVFEVEKGDATIDSSWVIAQNEAWGSVVLDLRNEAYRKYLLEKIEALHAKGFENFFFDTLDSYMLYAKTAEQKESFEKSLADFIQEVHRRFSNAKIVLNRGFEIIDSVHSCIDAVLFESYHYGLGEGAQGYKKVSNGDKEWLDYHIAKIQRYGLDVISVEYLPQDQMEKIDEAIDVIEAKGMIPYISERELDIYGKSSKNGLKREVFVLIDESQKDRMVQGAHQYLSMPLEYLGYIPKLYDLTQGLPDVRYMKHYAGVVIWLENFTTDPDGLRRWLEEIKKSGIKIVFMNNFGFLPTLTNMKFLEIDALQKNEDIDTPSKLVHYVKQTGFEIEASPNSLETLYLQPRNAKALLRYEDTQGQYTVPAAITSWGGYALDKALMVQIQQDSLWVIDPFWFLQEALELKPLAVPDVTTHNGRRIFFTHVDGDGIMNRAEFNPGLLAGDVIVEEILKPYKVPHSISFIGAEINPEGLYPDLSPRLLEIVKKTYALENVEAATHTYTHPFYWGKIEDATLDASYRLDVKGYSFSYEREILGSLEEINTKFLPSKKEHAKTIYWSGMCDPREDVLEFVYKHGILNINGGDTIITNSSPWLSLVAPLGLARGEYYQIYTGAQNENIYTNNWQGPYWGFKKVVQTFEHTEYPRRLKPINIYYHLYAGTKTASLRALKYAFDWALKQEIYPIYASEYIPKVMDFYTLSLSNEEETWLLEGTRDIKTVRFAKKVFADMERSDGVIGAKATSNQTYFHLDQGQSQRIVLRSSAPQEEVYLLDANVALEKVFQEKGKIRYRFAGHVPAAMRWHVPQKCNVTTQQDAEITRSSDLLTLTFPNAKEGVLDVTCR
jgi:hypothetical protein